MRRGKMIAWWSAGVGLAVLVVAGIAAKDRIVEAWYLWRFEKVEGEEKWGLASRLAGLGPDAKNVVEAWYIDQLHDQRQENRETAAKKLGELKSSKAVPHLMELFRQAPSREIYEQSLVGIGAAAVPELASLVRSQEGAATRRTFWEEWWKQGLPSTQRFAKLELIRIRAAFLLGKIGVEARAAVPALVDVVEGYEGLSLICTAASSLERIVGMRRASNLQPRKQVDGEKLRPGRSRMKTQTFRPTAGLLGKASSANAGAIPLREWCHFVADYTGRPVTVYSHNEGVLVGDPTTLLTIQVRSFTAAGAIQILKNGDDRFGRF